MLIFVSVSSCNNDKKKDKKYNELTDKDYQHKSDTVDGETVYFKSATVTNSPQDFINLDNSQKLFVKHNLENAGALIKQHEPNSGIDNFTPETLDKIIDKWNADSTKFACSGYYLVNSIGCAFGQYLVKTYRMKWTMVTDENGTDYATTLKDINLTNFPLNSVAKAIEQKTDGSLQTISLKTKHQISELNREIDR